ncbi:DASS family sodium-coupled anion symporter [Apibacter raozihei]|uniref:SLC13 family permease n=1 Tax=Apibacter TaxID=1778601 RepID=UPI000FE2BBC2|nr:MULTISPECIES: DASS family sodium-coupled anion symporter [Apibacter]
MDFDFHKINQDLKKINTNIRSYSDLLIEKSLDVWNIKTKVGLFFFSLGLSIAATYLISPVEFSKAQEYTMFILIFAILLWVTEAIPPFAVGIMIMGFLIYTMGNIEGSTLDPRTISNTWSDSVIWIFLGGFFLSEGMRKTSLDISLFKGTISIFGSKPGNMLLGIMLTTSCLSLIISNTATSAMILAAVMPFLAREGENSPMSKAILLCIPASATFAGMGSLISSPPNLIVVDALKSKGIDVSFFDWMILGLPVALVLLIVFWLILKQKYTSKVEKIDLDFLDINSELPAKIKLQRLFVVIILIITVVLWMMGSRLNIPTAATAGIPIMFLPMLGIITAEDIRKLPWDTLMLVAGGLSLGIAIKELLAPYYSQLLGNAQFNEYFIMIVFALVTIVFSNIMSSTATATIVINIAAVVLPPEQILPVGLVVGLCSSCGLFLPVSTPPNAIVYSTGMLKQSDFYIGGFFGAIVGTLVIIGWVLFLQQFTGFFEMVLSP